MKVKRRREKYEDSSKIGVESVECVNLYFWISRTFEEVRGLSLEVLRVRACAV